MYNDKIKLAFTDTDSFIIHVETDDIYTGFKHINQHMDLSDYPEIHECYNASKKRKFLGKGRMSYQGK